MQIHELFPTVVGEDLLDCHEEFKKNYFEDIKIKHHLFKESNNNSDLYFLHLNVKYLDFFKSVKNSIENYLILLGLDPTAVNLHVVRSWVESYNVENSIVDHHNHNSCDISFRYYIETDNQSDVICFQTDNIKNDLREGVLKFSDEGIITKTLNKYNCTGFGFTPKQGSLLLFPSPLKIETKIHDTNNFDRYVIAGDLKMTLKPKYYQNCQSIPHTSQWLDLDRY